MVVRRRVGASRIAPFCCFRLCYEFLLIVGNPIRNTYQAGRGLYLGFIRISRYLLLSHCFSFGYAKMGEDQC